MQLDPSSGDKFIKNNEFQVKDVGKTNVEKETKLDNDLVKSKIEVKIDLEKHILTDKEIRPRKNILYSFLDKVSSSAKKSIYGAAKKELTEMEFVKEQNPEIAKDFANALVVMDESESGNLSTRAKVECSPNPTSAGCSGSYFIKIAENLNLDKPEELKENIEKGTAKLKDAFIIKPSIQEIGSEGHPDGILNPGVDFGFVGIEGGKGAMREKLGDLVQKNSGLDFGIPPTGLAKVKNRQLGVPTPADMQLRIFTKFWGMKMTPQIFVKLGGEEFSPATFKKNLIDKIEHELYELGGDDLLKEFNDYFYEIDKTKPDVLPGFPEKLHNLDYTVGNQISYFANTMFKAKYSKDLDEKLESVWKELSSEAKLTEPSLASFQKLAEGCRSLSELKAEKQSDWISPKEFEKFAVDVILLNTDRHDGNVLVKEVSKDNLVKHLGEFGVDKGTLDKSVKEMLEQTKDKKLNLESHVPYVQEFLKSLPKKLQGNEKIEQGIHNLFYAEANHYKTTFELVLIDQGACLPDPDEGTKYLTKARYCWAFLPQGDTKLSGIARDKILALNIDKTIDNIKQSQQAYAKRYGKDCEISKACYHLMKLNFIVLKNIAKLNAPLSVGKTVMREADVRSIYEQQIRDVKKIDWKKIDELVEVHIKSKIN